MSLAFSRRASLFNLFGTALGVIVLCAISLFASLRAQAALTVPLVVTGSYVGNSLDGSNDDRSISGVGFQPDAVLIKGNNNQYAVIRTATMADDRTKQLNLPGTALESNLIQSFESDGFTIGTDLRVNGNGVTYYWLAFKSAPGELVFDTYTGNGSGQSVTGIGMQPEYVAIFSASSNSTRQRSAVMDNTYTFFSSTGSPNQITSLDADGFTVGNDGNVNANGTIYHYMAWNQSPGRMNVGSYTGNGSDNRDITGVGFQAEEIFITPKSVTTGTVHRPSSLSGDNVLFFDNLASETDKIQAIQSDGFQVGASSRVNGSGTSYFWLAFLRSSPPTFEQSSYRFYMNVDGVDVGSPLADQNTPVMLTASGESFRLRTLMHIDNDQLVQNGETFKLQFAGKGSGTCAAPSEGVPETYTDVTAETLIAFQDNATPADADPLTININDPLHNVDTITAQTYEEQNNFTNSTSAISTTQDAIWDFSLFDNGAPLNTTYCLRIVKSDGSELNLYTSYPEITSMNDVTAPTVMDVTSPNENGIYTDGANITIMITFSEPVFVDTTLGVPQLMLSASLPNVVATYVGGSGSNTLTFNYLIALGQYSLDLEYESTQALVLNGGIIQDIAENQADLTLPVPGEAASLSNNKNIEIQAQELSGGSDISIQNNIGTEIQESISFVSDPLPSATESTPACPPDTVGEFPDCQVLNSTFPEMISNTPEGSAPSRLDVFPDNVIDVLDFNLLLVNWGSSSDLQTGQSCSGKISADINCDGMVDILDFNLLMVYWGKPLAIS